MHPHEHGHHGPHKPHGCCRRKRHCCKMFPLLFGAAIGGIYGMLFAKTAGKDLRDKLKKSETPFMDFLKSGMQADVEFFNVVKEKVRKVINGK